MKFSPRQHVSALESDSFAATVPGSGSHALSVDNVVDAMCLLVRTLETE